MTTANLAADPAPGTATTVPQVPFSRLVRVELRKTYDTRAGMWLMIALAAVTLLAGVLFLIFADPPSDLSMLNFVGMSSFFQALLLPVLGILVVTSEWSQRTGLVTFTLEPSRLRLLAAKTAAVVLLGIAAAVLAILFSAIMTALAGVFYSNGGDWDFGPYAWLQLLVQQLFYLLAGYALGTIFLNSAAAIVVSYILPLAFSILISFPWFEDASPWLDKNTAMQNTLTGDMPASDWWRILVTSIWWLWLPLAAGVYRVVRTEIKSA
jgi:ABC-type transport system involved in multi-copper enzyme maturation permease subunit